MKQFGSSKTAALKRLVIGFVCLLLAGGRMPLAAATRPNVLLIMIDDLGYMDLACQGNKRVDTPNVDRLAAQGMRFTDAYAAAPVCSPTRAAIMSGISPARLQLTTHIPDRPDFARKNAPLKSAATANFLDSDYRTVAEYLHDAGYATAFLGKWHLAGKSQRQGLGDTRYYPERQGFDINIGGCAYGGPPTFFDPYRIHNLPSRREGEYLPDRLADEAINFIRSSKDKPFFLTLWNYTVHWPMEAPADLVKKYEQRKGPGVKDPRYAAMTEAMDTSIGRILNALDELELTDDTLVIFTSDNGGYQDVADNAPLREGKGYLYEGGIRIPLIVRWPGVAKKATLCDTPVVSTDLFYTILDAAKITPAAPTADGETMLPLLQQSGVLKRDAIYFHYPNYAWHGNNRLGGAVRQGDYKLIENYADRSLELYNLADDISEKNNLATKMPDRTAVLAKKLRHWLQETKAQMPTPIGS